MAQPAALISVLSMQIQGDLGRLRALKRATVNYNLTLSNPLAKTVNLDLKPLTDAVAAIPAPTFTLADMNAWLASPLIALVLELDTQTKKDVFANLDAHLQQVKLTAVLRAYARQLSMRYEDTISALESYNVLKMAKTYLSEMARINYRADDYARSLRIVAQFRGLSSVDPSLIDEYKKGPFHAFELASSGFTFTGEIPDEFASEVRVFLTPLAAADAKLRGWRVLGARGLQ